MAMRFVDSSWKESLYSSPAQWNERFYIDFRRQDYLPINSSPTYTLITSSDNQPGSHYLSGGALKYLYTLPDTFTVEIKFKAQFAYDVADDQCVFQWQESATQFFQIFYDSTSDKFIVYWRDAGTAAHLESQQFDDGTSYADLTDWVTLTVAVDLTTGTTAGSQLWIDRTSQDTGWSGNIDTPTINQVELDINPDDNYDIAYIRFFDGLVATDTQVSNAFETVTNEELYWNFDGNAIGRLRCNINRHVKSWTYSASCENDGGSQTANRVSMTLYNLQGQFADDQYAAFDPTNDIFNGTSSQKYLRQRCGVFVESWYGTDFEPLFVGYLDESRFPRSTRSSKYSEVSITAEDYVAQIANTFKEKPTYFENKDIADTADETNSLAHLITRLATQRILFNYAADSSFETDATPASGTGSSWYTNNCTLTRDSTYTFCGSTYSGKAVFSAGGELSQRAYFYTSSNPKQYAAFGVSTEEYLDADSEWYVSVWVRSDAAFNGTLKIQGYTGIGDYDEATESISLTGGEGWTQYTTSVTMTADRYAYRIDITADTGTLYVNGVTVGPGDGPYNSYVQNDNERVGFAFAGSIEYVSTANIETAEIGYCGFDIESFDVQHPWVLIKERKPIWEEVKALADAMAARYCGMDKAGTFRLRSSISGTDPTSLETVDTVRSIATVLDKQTANHVVVHGARITKASVPQIVWMLSATQLYEDMLDEGDNFNLTLAGTGSKWPPDSAQYELWAKYGDVT